PGGGGNGDFEEIPEEYL
nr:Chain J, Hirulog [synthetic construct]3VXE_J Chain J, BIVALIRUDIN [synthetic construct]3VXF_J Chain J, BIVALIRUDIN [unidentified]